MVPDSAVEPEGGISVGTFIAVYLEKYSNERPPYIGYVVSIDSDTVTIHWWAGCYSGIWKPCNTRKGRNTVPWEEEIPRTCILACVSLSQSHRLSEKSKTELKELYSKYL